IHRVAAVATEEMATEEVACIFYGAINRQMVDERVGRRSKPSTAWPRWLQKRWLQRKWLQKNVATSSR
ncbi:MAG: hypothetical protein ACK44Z_14870, partial [Pirellulaceae bacterium]